MNSQLPMGAVTELPPPNANDASFGLLNLVGVLLNIHYLSHNPDFVKAHGHVVSGSLYNLTTDLSKAIGRVDPLLLDALSAKPDHA